LHSEGKKKETQRWRDKRVPRLESLEKQAVFVTVNRNQGKRGEEKNTCTSGD